MKINTTCIGECANQNLLGWVTLFVLFWPVISAVGIFTWAILKNRRENFSVKTLTTRLARVGLPFIAVTSLILFIMYDYFFSYTYGATSVAMMEIIAVVAAIIIWALLYCMLILCLKFSKTKGRSS